METETSPHGPGTASSNGDNLPGSGGGGSGSGPGPAKRTRVLLSCGPCRASKLKCDRSEPCGQCLKKSRPEGCVYAPKPDKQKPAKGMAARLKRLEGMVRTMMDEGGEAPAPAQVTAPKEEGVAQPGGQFFQGENATTYVGATHFMAILEDIEDMKSFLEEPDVVEEESPEPDELEAPDMLLFSRNAPRNRGDLLRLIPERKIVDRLVMRYFSSQTPSQHIIHRPTFVKQYADFWTNPSGTSIHWLALLFMIMAAGLFSSSFTAPDEVAADSPQPPMDRFKTFRAAAAWCLVSGKYTQPSIATIPPFILYVESEFVISRAAQTNCYVLSSVCLRLLLKMGLHRDPDRLANVSPFEGEMRRRMWNMAAQLDLLVSFHMGLPSMLNGIDSDADLPRNLFDEDFAPCSATLPPPRPLTDYTELTYPILKSSLMRVFGQIARQAHLLAPPPYPEITRLDALLNERWRAVPSFMRVRPLEECVTDAPAQIIQRFGLASLYNKCRCVLHRRFLVEPAARREHDYSRWQCLEGAMTQLNYQNVFWHASQPGNLLHRAGWYLSSLAVHDLLLAATVVYLAVGNEAFWTTGEHEWMGNMTPRPTREGLLDVLQRSYAIWVSVAGDVPELNKTAGILETMLGKLGSPPSPPPREERQREKPGAVTRSEGSASGTVSSQEAQLFDNLSINDAASFPAHMANHFQSLDFVNPSLGSSDSGLDRGWVAVGNEMDWRYFDNIVSQTNNEPMGTFDANRPWFDQAPDPIDFDFSAPGAWDPNLGQQG
ncbi:Fusarisetin A cluster transcription factor fsa6 [Colletotrichum trifolii]|uniref:Fusarisetin A cluster transcription factor fsa6 n=1 Tax=Colletotrichum trifolii TaxID=5466 RepID=A0A4R8RBF1_COLTR|nr:Fusarisetin A cluster transcription factor fsa6 [Colletotrichum trifolii]